MCALAVNQIVWPASHNSMASSAYDFFGAEQSISVPEQLNAGVRLLMLDAYYGYDDRGLVRTNLAGAVDRKALAADVGPDAVDELDRLGALTGTVEWKVTTNPEAAAVEYFFENKSVAKVEKPGREFTYSLDTTKYANGAHSCGWHVLGPDGAILFRSPAVHVTTANQEVKPPTPPVPDEEHAAAKDAWNTKQLLQAEIKALQNKGMNWQQIQRNLGSVRPVPVGQVTLSWKSWQIVKDAKDPDAPAA